MNGDQKFFLISGQVASYKRLIRSTEPENVTEFLNDITIGFF